MPSYSERKTSSLRKLSGRCEKSYRNSPAQSKTNSINMRATRSLLSLCAVAASVTAAAAFIFDEEEAIGDGCVTPDGFKGDCVNLLRCRPLAMLLRRPISAKAKHLLRKSVCGGLRNRVPDVCCPRSGTIRTTTEAPMIFFGGQVLGSAIHDLLVESRLLT